MFKNSSINSIEKSDRKYAAARDKLNREYVRGFVVEWENNFKRLDRFYKNREEYETDSYEDVYPIMLANAVNDCLDYQNTHIYAQNPSVETMLSDLEDELTEELFYLAEQIDFDGNDVYHALSFLVKRHKLNGVIEYLDSLAESV